MYRCLFWDEDRQLLTDRSEKRGFMASSIKSTAEVKIPEQYELLKGEFVKEVDSFALTLRHKLSGARVLVFSIKYLISDFVPRLRMNRVFHTLSSIPFCVDLRIFRQRILLWS